jgi:hypothetical protein
VVVPSAERDRKRLVIVATYWDPTHHHCLCACFHARGERRDECGEELALPEMAWRGVVTSLGNRVCCKQSKRQHSERVAS